MLYLSALQSRLTEKYCCMFSESLLCRFAYKVYTLRSVNDVTEGITQETPMGASWVIPRKVNKMV